MINTKQGMTLNEILLAVSILALSFIPIIGVISSSMRTTEKDDHIIKGLSLCQEKLSAALQFPYDKIPEGTYNADITNDNGDLSITIKLGNEEFRIPYYSELVVTNETVKYKVPMCDFTKRAKNPSNPGAWMSTKNVEVKDMVKRYTVTVRWNEKEGGPGAEQKKRFYTLSALKANVRR